MSKIHQGKHHLQNWWDIVISFPCLGFWNWPFSFKLTSYCIRTTFDLASLRSVYPLYSRLESRLLIVIANQWRISGEDLGPLNGIARFARTVCSMNCSHCRPMWIVRPIWSVCRITFQTRNKSKCTNNEQIMRTPIRFVVCALLTICKVRTVTSDLWARRSARFAVRIVRYFPKNIVRRERVFRSSVVPGWG